MLFTAVFVSFWAVKEEVWVSNSGAGKEEEESGPSSGVAAPCCMTCRGSEGALVANDKCSGPKVIAAASADAWASGAEVCTVPCPVVNLEVVLWVTMLFFACAGAFDAAVWDEEVWWDTELWAAMVRVPRLATVVRRKVVQSTDRYTLIVLYSYRYRYICWNFEM